MKVIITGATGFIGTALSQNYIKNGHEVSAIVRPNSNKCDKLPKEVKVIELPLNRLNELDGQYDLFYHLAWNGSSGLDRYDFNTQYSNIQFTGNAIKAAKQCGCIKFIGAGSQAEYGVVNGICNEDRTVTNPFMLYGAAKLAAYHMGKLLSEQLRINFVWPRIYSIYGVGENDGTLISTIIESFRNGKVPQLTQCKNMWDFMYITDCVKALRLLGEHNDAIGVYNVSAGNPKLLKEFIYDIGKIFDLNKVIKFGEKTSDAKKTFWLEPDIEKLKKLGFQMEVDFLKGINKIIEND